MDARTLLDRLMTSGRDLADKGGTWAADKAGVPEDEEARRTYMKGLGGGAAAAGALALLLGTKAGRKLGGSALTIGALAAVGGLAYKAYRDHQAREAGTDTSEVDTGRARVLLIAMAAAANADGHISVGERDKLRAEAEAVVDPSDRPLIDELLKVEPEAEVIAALADTPELAREIYAASVMVADRITESERTYLDALAGHLKLDPGLAAAIETEVRGARA